MNRFFFAAIRMPPVVKGIIFLLKIVTYPPADVEFTEAQ